MKRINTNFCHGINKQETRNKEKLTGELDDLWDSWDSGVQVINSLKIYYVRVDNDDGSVGKALCVCV